MYIYIYYADVCFPFFSDVELELWSSLPWIKIATCNIEPNKQTRAYTIVYTYTWIYLHVNIGCNSPCTPSNNLHSEGLDERYIFPSNIPQQSPNIRPAWKTFCRIEPVEVLGEYPSSCSLYRYSRLAGTWWYTSSGYSPKGPLIFLWKNRPSKTCGRFQQERPQGWSWTCKYQLSVARNDNTMASIDVIYQDRVSPESEDCRKLNWRRRVCQVVALLHWQVYTWFRSLGRVFENLRIATESPETNLDCICEVSNTSRLRRFCMLLQIDCALPNRTGKWGCGNYWSDGASWWAIKTTIAREVPW